MKVLHPEDDLREPVEDDGLGKATPSFPLSREERREVAPGAVRHDDVHAVPVDEGLDALEDAGVVHALHDGHLAQTHLALGFLRGKLHLLQDHLRGVGRRGDATSEENPAVAPLADLAGDLVVANHREGHGDGRRPEADAPTSPRARGDATDASAARRRSARLGASHSPPDRNARRRRASGGAQNSRARGAGPDDRRLASRPRSRRAGQTLRRPGRVAGSARPGVRATGRRASETARGVPPVVVVVRYSDVCFVFENRCCSMPTTH